MVLIAEVGILTRPNELQGSPMQQDPVVEALVPDPAQGPPATAVLYGHVGNSPDPGVWRLYLTDDLGEYVDIPEGEILHSQQLGEGRGTLVWVSRSAALHYVRVRSQQVQAGFLSGAITSGNLRRVTSSPQGSPLLRPALWPESHICTHINDCAFGSATCGFTDACSVTPWGFGC